MANERKKKQKRKQEDADILAGRLVVKAHHQLKSAPWPTSARRSRSASRRTPTSWQAASWSRPTISSRAHHGQRAQEEAEAQAGGRRHPGRPPRGQGPPSAQERTMANERKKKQKRKQEDADILA